MDISIEPYVTLISILRSEIGDLLVGLEEDEEGFEFTDEQLGKELNNGFILRVERDFDTSLYPIDSDGNLSSSLLSDTKIRSATVLAAAERAINITLQSASGQNIEIAMRGRRINFKNLVTGLQDSLDKAKNKYKEALMSSTVGHTILPR